MPLFRIMDKKIKSKFELMPISTLFFCERILIPFLKFLIWTKPVLIVNHIPAPNSKRTKSVNCPSTGIDFQPLNCVGKDQRKLLILEKIAKKLFTPTKIDSMLTILSAQ